MLSKKKLHIKKNILIIGSTGFVGSYLCKFLKKKNFNIYQIARSKKKIKNYFCADIADFQKLNTLIAKINITFDIIINLTGQISNNAKEMKKNIILGNKNLIKIFKKKNIKIFYLSTVLVYGNSSNSQGENSKTKPFTQYGKIKLKAECLYKALYKNFIIVRSANIYDEKFLKKGLLKNIFESIKNNKVLDIKNINSSRNYIHINDFCFLIYKACLLSHIEGKEVVNFGNENITNMQIIKIVENNNLKLKLRHLNLSMKQDLNILVNSKKIKKLYNYKPKYLLKKTIDNYIIKNEIK